ncbi:MAG: ATP-dependent zinc protease family protein [Planctomycetota bacterium]|jgi:hypothetical protein
MSPPKPVRKKRKRRTPGANLPVLGWREWVALPDLGVSRIKVKVDTGARSSAIHAYDLHLFRKADGPWVRFTLHPIQRDTKVTTRAECPIKEFRRVRSSSGQMEMRPVIETTLRVQDKDVPMELTLARRDEMGFRMLLGRSAVRNRFLVHPGRSFLAGKKRRKKPPPAGGSPA